MNEWGFISQDILVGIAPKGPLSGENPSQVVLNLNQRVAMCETRG